MVCFNHGNLHHCELFDVNEINTMEAWITKFFNKNDHKLVGGLFVVVVLFLGWDLASNQWFSDNNGSVSVIDSIPQEKLWAAPSDSELPAGDEGELIKYGRELVAHTAQYFGPNGSIAHFTNGLNCQNCHLNAGTQPWGNNYGSVASTYPKFRGRSGSIENIYKRVSDCFERSLNGKAPDSASREMQAMMKYINWLGKNVPKKEKAPGSGIMKVAFLNRPIDPVAGKLVYDAKCAVCHQADGQGVLNDQGNAYTYPPLWGKLSYNEGAGLFRMSNFAGYVKANMPLGATHNNPQLTDEEAWDVAAYVNTQERPKMDLSKDWPDISKKPFDHPFGPYADKFPEKQHKFGPYAEIKAYYEAMKD